MYLFRMEYVALGNTGLLISTVAFAAISINSSNDSDTSVTLLQSAYSAGVNFFDTTHAKVKCEALLGKALSNVRDNIMLSTKTQATSVQDMLLHLQESMNLLQTSHIDLYQIENPKIVPTKSDALYQALCDMKAQGKVRHIGIATDDFDIACTVIDSGLYEVLQFPFNVISSPEVKQLVDKCANSNMGFIAMQPLCGGVVSNVPLALGFLKQYETVIPLWDISSLQELQQVVYFAENPPNIDEKFKEDAARERQFFN